MTRDADRWREYSIVMPLREEWGKNPDGWLEAEPAFQMGPRVETQNGTMDLRQILDATRFSAEQAAYIGQFANALQALHLSGVPADQIAYIGSDLLDNIWNQQFDGAYIVREIMIYCVERVRRGEMWFRPAYGRIAARVNELHQELYGTPANPLFGRYEQWETMFSGVKRTADIADVIDLTLAARANGPVEKLTEPVDERVALLGAALVRAVQDVWKTWGKNRYQVEKQRGVRRAVKDQRIAELTKKTLERISELTGNAYRKATDGDYIPGSLTCAIRQASTALADRWEAPKGNGTRIPASRRLLPKPEYKILHGLPLSETMAHYRTDGETGPSWLTRVMPSAQDLDLLPGDEVVIERTETGDFRMRRLGEEEIVGTLQTEGYGLVDLCSRFVGWVHEYDNVRAADGAFYGPRIAVFRNSHRELLSSMTVQSRRATDELKSMSM